MTTNLSYISERRKFRKHHQYRAMFLVTLALCFILCFICYRANHIAKVYQTAYYDEVTTSDSLRSDNQMWMADIQLRHFGRKYWRVLTQSERDSVIRDWDRRRGK